MNRAITIGLLAVAVVLAGCSTVGRIRDDFARVDSNAAYLGPPPGPGMISYQRAWELAMRALPAGVSYDAAIPTTVDLREDRYVVTFPRPAGESVPPGAYAARITLDAHTGKVIESQAGY